MNEFHLGMKISTIITRNHLNFERRAGEWILRTVRLVLRAMAQVFTTEFINKLERRWSPVPAYGRPTIVRIALDDSRRAWRERIEYQVQQLDSHDAPKVIRLLRTEDKFETTYGELIVAQLLVNAGFHPRYEQEFTCGGDTLTPDWFVGEAVPWICEVFTAGGTKARQTQETALREIKARLTRIKAPFTLKVTIIDAAAFDPRSRKQFANDVRRWLDSRPVVGDIWTVAAATLEVLAVGGTHVRVITIDPIDPQRPVETPESVASNFEQKARHYASLKLPVVVAAVKHPESEEDAADIENVLAGTAAYVTTATLDGDTVGFGCRLGDGVFAKCGHLSAAIWIEPYSFDKPVVQFWTNPTPLYPLPQDAIDRLAAASL